MVVSALAPIRAAGSDGRAGSSVGLERTRKSREGSRWLEVNPAIAGKVHLRPGMGISPHDIPLIRLGIVLAVGIARRHARGNAQLARHQSHSSREVVTEAALGLKQEPGRS